MRIVLAPDKFKDSLAAAAVAAAMAEGIRQVDPSISIDSCPMADGGEGTVEALVAATNGRIERCTVTGPLPGTHVDAPFGILGDGKTAIIEMAAASGLHLLKPQHRNPMRTTTFGTGELLQAAANAGAKRIILGIGGSATVDGGIGCAQACGARVELRNGRVYSASDRKLTGADVCNILSIEPPLAMGIEFIVACDVGNSLFGPSGAARIFGPQKGATARQVEQLDDALHRLAQCTGRLAIADTPGCGAAGGLGFGMLAFFAAKLRSGIEIVMEATRLRERLAKADLCLTGEGRLDAQSLAGKTVIGVARLSRQLAVPCIALAGSIGEGAEGALAEGITAYFSVCDGPMSLEEAMRDAARLLSTTTASTVRTFRQDTERSPEVMQNDAG